MTSGGNNFNDFPDNQLTKFQNHLSGWRFDIDMCHHAIFIGLSRIFIPIPKFL